MFKSGLCDYSDPYILGRRTKTITEEGDVAPKRGDERKKGVNFKNCATFTDCISEIYNTQIDNAKDLDVVMPIYNRIEYCNNYLKTSGSLW